MFINGLSEGDRVGIIDDVISTGGTLRSVRNALSAEGIELAEALVVYNKCPDISALESEPGFPIRFLLRVGVRDGRLVIL